VRRVLSYLAVAPFFRRTKEEIGAQFLPVKRSISGQNCGHLHGLQDEGGRRQMEKSIGMGVCFYSTLFVCLLTRFYNLLYLL